MSTANPYIIGKTISVPQFFFTTKPPNTELSSTTNKSLFFSVGSSLSISKRSSSLCCIHNNNNSVSVDTKSEKWDWNRWIQHFSEIEQIENDVSLLKVQLEEAIEIENFEQASKLKSAIEEASMKDVVAEIMFQLQTAISEERYHDASKLCSKTGSGLVGWWVGYPQDSDEPFGRILRITPGFGRFIGKSYSPRQLVTAAAAGTGTPLFEIFVVKDNNGGYVMQVVYLQHVKRKSSISENPELRAPQPPNASLEKPSTLDDVRGSEPKEEDKKEDKKVLNADEPSEEGISNVIKFLKDKIPGLKLKIMDVTIPDDDDDSVTDDLVESIEEIISADEEEDDSESIEEISSDDGKSLSTKLFIGGVVHNTEDLSIEDEVVRVSADITNKERDSFILHVPERRKSDDTDTRKSRASKEQVTALAAQGISDLMPPEVAKAFWGSEKASLKVSRNVREIVKLAIKQAQRGNRLSECTRFNRIVSPESDLDPFNGLYVGAFGPYGTEIVQLKRKYGRWRDYSVSEEDNSSDIEFCEYVEAVKLTGDPNVPAGQVTFRAKIGNQKRNRGQFPEELGVLASYEGQGRIADFGFKNPRWVEGKLLKLSGKGMGPFSNGGDLGFLYSGPEQSFLVVFNRLRLPE